MKKLIIAAALILQQAFSQQLQLVHQLSQTKKYVGTADTKKDIGTADTKKDVGTADNKKDIGTADN
jgi:hypothetical protein